MENVRNRKPKTKLKNNGIFFEEKLENLENEVHNKIQKDENNYGVTHVPKSQSHTELITFYNERKKFFRFNFEVDFLSILLFITALFTRMYKLEEPKNIV